MFRKLGNMITTCLLLVSTTGFAVSEHFCGTDLVSIEIAKEADDCCDNGMCCHSETDFYQLDEDFIVSATEFNFYTDVVYELPQQVAHSQFGLTEKGVETLLYADFESPPPRERRQFLASIQTYIL